jgi:hypothetical protein
MAGTNFPNGLEIAGVPLSVSPVTVSEITGLTASLAELNLLDDAGAVVASGTEQNAIADITDEANGTAIATAVNALIAALDAFGITATE